MAADACVSAEGSTCLDCCEGSGHFSCLPLANLRPALANNNMFVDVVPLLWLKRTRGIFPIPLAFHLPLLLPYPPVHSHSLSVPFSLPFSFPLPTPSLLKSS